MISRPSSSSYLRQVTPEMRAGRHVSSYRTAPRIRVLVFEAFPIIRRWKNLS